MAARVFLVLSLYFAYAACAPAKSDICACDNATDADLEQIWEFLKETSSKQEDYPISPGMLSPSVPCSNCIDNNRRKRNPEAEVTTTKPVEEDEPEDLDYGSPDGIEDSSCPQGSLRRGKWCVQIAALG